MAFSISKIYVSTPDSVTSGQANWGIPKEQADFTFDTGPSGQQRISVSQRGETFFSVRANAWGPRFPITTKLLPGFRVVQEPIPSSGSGQLLLTAPTASGSARLTSLMELTVDTASFPDLHRGKPLAALTLHDFRMTFPVPKYISV